MAKLLMWSIVDIDDGILGTFNTKKEALDFCRCNHLDGRKYAGWKRERPGFYEYRAPLHNGRIDTHWVGTKAMLLRNGFDWAIEAFEQDKPVNEPEEWNALASPTMY